MDQFGKDKYFDGEILDRCIKFGIKMVSRPDNHYLTYQCLVNVKDCITKGHVSFTNTTDAKEYLKIVEYHMQKRIEELTRK